MIRRTSLITCAIVLALIGCRQADPPPPPTTGRAPQSLPTTQIAIKGQPFTLQVADDPDEHQTGLMHVRSMPADHGMIFVFPEEAPRSFWMKNTLIPLDIAYLDRLGRVVNVAKMYPQDLSGVPSKGPAKYAVELNQGMSEKIGLKAGDRIVLPASLE